MTCMMFDNQVGIVIVFYYGNFKMFDPVMFKQTWHHEEMNMKDPSLRSEVMTFILCRYSSQFNYLAIGGLDGKIFMYDLRCKTKVGMNKKAHKDQIVDIFFNDSIIQMVTVSRDKQISLWDTAMF